MENLFIQGNQRVPTIDFNANTGQFSIKGQCLSISGYEVEFFDPVIDWLTDYSKSQAKSTIMNVTVKWLASGALRRVLDIFRILEEMYLSGHHVEINWYYPTDDIDILEDGEDYKDILKVPFHLIEF